MEAMVDDQGNVVVSQSSGATTVAASQSSGSMEAVVSPSQSESAHSPATQVVTTATGQTIAVPTAGGAVSIVHVAALPNQQPVQVQSVIQPNQQSVIQTNPGSGLQAVQLSKGNVILLNKGAAGSVIHSATGAASLQAVQKYLQVATLADAGEDGTCAEDENKKRREILARRPSYRKILNELSAAETPTITSDMKDDAAASSEASSQEASEAANTITVAGVTDGSPIQYSIVPAGAIQITGSQAEGLQGLQTLTMTNAGAGTTGTIVQYAQGQDGQFFVPVTVSAADIQAYQIRGPTATATSLSQGVVMAPASNIQTPQQMAEETARKRELRLLKNSMHLYKNREAARECRRKKKEYIKCLENRVAVLENQNKALIEELKSLKELYCQKNE